MRDYIEVECQHAYDCFAGHWWGGKGAWPDDLSSAMGGKPFQECRCMTDSERLELAIEGQEKKKASKP